jgi:hypothetical protein
MAKRATRAKGSSQDNAADQIRPTKAGRRPRKKEGARGATAGRTFGAYGWVPDLPDHRDLMYSAPLGVIGSIPKKIDLRPHCPPWLTRDSWEAAPATPSPAPTSSIS